MERVGAATPQLIYSKAGGRGRKDQELPKEPQERPKRPQDDPKKLQGRPRGLNDGPKRSQETPKAAPRSQFWIKNGIEEDSELEN